MRVERKVSESRFESNTTRGVGGGRTDRQDGEDKEIFKGS